MHFIPVQQVFVCMSVNKKWQEAARHTVRNHRRVHLVAKYNLRQHEVQFPNPRNLIVEKSTRGDAPRLRQLAKSLRQMGNSSFVFRSKTREEQMDDETDSITGLCTTHDDQDEEEDEEFVLKILQAAKRLVNLTHLTIWFDPDVDYFAPVHDLSTLMDNFTSLVHLELVLTVTDFDFDPVLIVLMMRIPHLSSSLVITDDSSLIMRFESAGVHRQPVC